MVKRRKSAKLDGGSAPMDLVKESAKSKDLLDPTLHAMDTSEAVAKPSSDVRALSTPGRPGGKKLAPQRRVFKLRKKKAFDKAIAVEERKAAKRSKMKEKKDRNQSLKGLY